MKKILISLVRGYQKRISPLFPPSCRYYPTCSNYTMDALDKHGALKGSLMGIARILRCHPFVEGGIDPVPDYFTLKRQRPKSKRDDEERNNQPEQEEAHLVDYLLNKYQKEIVTDLYPLDQLLEDHFELEILPFTTMSPSFSKEVNQQATNYGVVEPEFKLYQVTEVKDDELIMEIPFKSPINEAVDDTKHCYLLVEETLGLLKASHQELGVDLVLATGVSKKDIEGRTPRLKHYLTVLDELEV